ncbi:hypothetical protein Hamer_G001512, partial [Homarus americanus]
CGTSSPSTACGTSSPSTACGTSSPSTACGTSSPSTACGTSSPSTACSMTSVTRSLSLPATFSTSLLTSGSIHSHLIPFTSPAESCQSYKSSMDPICRICHEEISRALLVDGMCMLLLTPLAALSIYLCTMGALQYINGNDEHFTAFTNQFIVLTKQRVVRIKDSFEPRKKYGHQRDHEGEKGGDKPWEGLGLVLLALLLLAIYIAWATIVIRYQARVWRRWRLIHQDLELVNTHRSPSYLSTTFYHNLRTSLSPISLQTFNILSPGQQTVGSLPALSAETTSPSPALQAGEETMVNLDSRQDLRT